MWEINQKDLPVAWGVKFAKLPMLIICKSNYF